MKATLHYAQNIVEAGTLQDDLSVTLLNEKLSSPPNPQVATQIGSDKGIEVEQVLFPLGTKMIVISEFGTYVKTEGVDHRDRARKRYCEFLIRIVDRGAPQVLKQEHPGGF